MQNAFRLGDIVLILEPGPFYESGGTVTAVRPQLPDAEGQIEVELVCGDIKTFHSRDLQVLARRAQAR